MVNNKEDINQENRLSLQIGTLLHHGEYRIDMYLASGGFGNTYLATNSELHSQVVVKEFFIGSIANRGSDGVSISITSTENKGIWEKMLGKFYDEARRLYAINHPNIVRVHALFKENGTAYYVMDKIDGQTLREVVRQRGRPFSEQELRDFLRDILSAIDEIHSRGILHLDIKPANLMLDNQTRSVKLIDFGASKQFSADGNKGHTSTILPFTPGYASPEQAEQNVKKIGPHSDFFSLGATLYNLLTGKTPPPVSDIYDLRSAAFDFSGVDVGEPFKWAIIKLMSINRFERPQSVSQVKELLQAKRPPVLSVHNDETTQILLKDNNRTITYSKPWRKRLSLSPVVSSRLKRVLLVVGIVLAVSIAGITGYGLYRYYLRPKISHAGEDPSQVTNARFTFTDNVGYSYSGKIDLSTQLPDGEGEATFDDRRTYKGHFTNGQFDGYGEFYIPSSVNTVSQRFVGQMKNNLFNEGKLVFLDDDSYYEGTFNEYGKFLDGKYCDKNGTMIYQYVEGEKVKQEK